MECVMSNGSGDRQAAHISPFDAIRHEDEDGNEYWSARELSKLLGYDRWENFRRYVIPRTQKACENSGHAASDHVRGTTKLIKAGKGAQRPVEDFELSRFACYLVVENADPAKPIVALGQHYFAVQTRRQEIADELALANLPEDQKRLVFRSLMSTYNTRLADAAQQAGVVAASDFSTFQDHGYMGLYGGLRENDIHARKSLTSEKQNILDYMGSEELGANIFRATQTDAKLHRENIQGKDQANQTHLEIGNIVRKAIAEAGGMMPEHLPTPEKSIQELQRDEQKRIEAERQPSLFDQLDERKNSAHMCHILQPLCVVYANDFYANGRYARFSLPCVLL
jgi:DNA-damage-inducible protein D